MARCADFYSHWIRDPNWCEKAPETAKAIDRYISYISWLESCGFDRESLIKNMPESNVRSLIHQDNEGLDGAYGEVLLELLEKYKSEDGKLVKKITKQDVKRIKEEVLRVKFDEIPYWKKVEKKALSVLEKSGFLHIVNLNELCHNPYWDYYAEINEEKWVIDVTTDSFKAIWDKYYRIPEGYRGAVLYYCGSEKWKVVEIKELGQNIIGECVP